MAVKLSALRAGRRTPPMKIPGTHFCHRLSRHQGHSATGRIRSTEKSKDLIGIRSRDQPACSIVSQPTTLPRGPTLTNVLFPISHFMNLNERKFCLLVPSVGTVNLSQLCPETRGNNSQANEKQEKINSLDSKWLPPTVGQRHSLRHSFDPAWRRNVLTLLTWNS
jgi:hypothetical protein